MSDILLAAYQQKFAEIERLTAIAKTDCEAAERRLADLYQRRRAAERESEKIEAERENAIAQDERESAFMTLSVAEVGRDLGATARTVRFWITRGGLRARRRAVPGKLGTMYLIRRADLEAWLKAGKRPKRGRPRIVRR